MYRFTILLSIILLSSCFSDDHYNPKGPAGMRPIYVQIGDDISQEAMSFDDLTNIVVYQELILALEENVGIHIIDNSDPMNPTNALFIPITGLTDIAIKEDIVIANAGTSLISVDISDRTSAIIKSIKFIEEISSAGNNLYPEGYNGLFECVDPDNGLVVNWELVEMNESKCWR